MESLIEFVTVVRNDLDGLKKTVNSIDSIIGDILELSSFSHLIIDGDSNDGCSSFAQGLVTTRAIHTRCISEPDLGIYDGMNKGVRYSIGKTLVFLNAGDVLSDSFKPCIILNAARHMCLDNDVALTAFSALLSFPKKNFLIESRVVDKNKPRLPTIHQSILYSKHVLENNLFDISYKVCGDYEQFSRVYSQGYTVVVNKMVLANFFSGGVSTQKPFVLFKESVSVSDKYFELTLFRRLLIRVKLLISLVVFAFLNKLYR